jgi:HME family heavy-metal exporter
MLQKLIGFSLKYSGFIVMVAVLLLAFSAYQVPKMPVDVFPELNAPTVVLLTEAGGLLPTKSNNVVPHRDVGERLARRARVQLQPAALHRVG